MKHLQLSDENYREVHAAFARFLRQEGYARTTCSMLPSCVQEFLHFLEGMDHFILSEIGPEHVQAYYKHLLVRPNARRPGGLSSIMVGHQLFALRTFFAWLVRMEAMDIDPMTSLSFPKAAPVRRVALSQEQVSALYRGARTKVDRAILALLYGCGLRRSEAVQLNTQDMDLGAGRLIVRKGKFGKRRELPLGPQVLGDLMDYHRRERCAWVRYDRYDSKDAFLLTIHGDRMTGGTMYVHLKHMAERAGITDSVYPHRLRHSIATHLMDNGMPMKLIQQFLGHASLDVTELYLTGNRTRWRKTHPYRRKIHQGPLHEEF